MKKIYHLLPKKIRIYVYTKVHYLLQLFKYKVLSISEITGNYYCPVCEHKIKRYNSLAPFLDGKFINNIHIQETIHFPENYETYSIDSFFCPICGAQDKARLYAFYIKEFIINNVSNSNKVKFIHFAPETGLSFKLNNYKILDYYTSEYNNSYADYNLDLTNMSVIPTSNFDFFICSHILEHIIDDNSAIRELRRILKKGGKGIIMVPIMLTLTDDFYDPSIISDDLRLKHFGQEDHVRVYSKTGFVNKLKNNGFNVSQLGIDFFGHETFYKLGLTNTTTLYIVD